MSYIPFCIAISTHSMNSGERGLEFTVANSCMGINIIVNPLIYTFTNRRFCSFMKTMIGIEQNVPNSVGFAHTSANAIE